MPEIEISADQREYLDDLRAELAARHVGEYGHVRPRDALQYLIDQAEGAIDGEEGAIPPAGEQEETDEDASADTETEGQPEDAESRLEAMMNLLDHHADKWTEANEGEGKYAVTLPDGSTESVRTKDDVRALLFQHYD